jgi:hypothetical protein
VISNSYNSLTKRCLQLWHQSSVNHPQESHNNSANSCSLLGNCPIRLELFFFLLGMRGFLWVWIMESQNVMGSGYGSNISERIEIPFWLITVRFRCKFVKKKKKWNFAIFGHKRIFAREQVKKRTRVYVRKGRLARPAAELGNFHRTRYLSLS